MKIIQFRFIIASIQVGSANEFLQPPRLRFIGRGKVFIYFTHTYIGINTMSMRLFDRVRYSKSFLAISSHLIVRHSSGVGCPPINRNCRWTLATNNSGSDGLKIYLSIFVCKTPRIDPWVILYEDMLLLLMFESVTVTKH